MQYILTPAQMRSCDRYIMDELGIPPEILMEDAARAAFEAIQSALTVRFPKYFSSSELCGTCRILVLCGSGNNGGDGFALARMFSHSADVRVAWIGSLEKMSVETALQFSILRKHGILVQHIAQEEDIAELNIAHADCILDAMMGAGSSENVRGMAEFVLQHIQSIRAESRPFTVAIDVPTGLNAETGRAHPNCICADLTVTMAACKTGLMLNDGPDVCGEIVIVPIGIPAVHIAQESRIRVLEDADVRTLFPARRRRSNKHAYGSIAVIGGTATMSGAPALAANACITAGAGIVRLYAPHIHPALMPEVMAVQLPATASMGGISQTGLPLLERALEAHDVIVIGMGIGTEQESLNVVQRLVQQAPPHKTLILDADGLRALKQINGEILTVHRNTICTPHHGEFARLTGENYADIPLEAHIVAPQWAARLGCTMLLKNAPTIISNGEVSYWNPTGNPGLATAGSGDVLAGIIGAVIAQGAAHGMDALHAAAVGAYLHGKAGDIYAAEFSQETLTASRIIQSLERAFAALGNEQ